MELNAEQIKKVLEHCANWTFETGCEGCPYDGNCIDKDVMKDALALINSQEQRIEKLAVELEAMRCAANSYKMHNKELTEENERLSQSLANSKSILANSKADTVREMHSEIKERCLKGGIYPAFVANTIDQIAKEMLEARND